MQRTVRHGSFTIERELPYPPARVFAAWADPREKAQWFAAASDLYKVVIRKQEFHPGGIDGHAGREQGTRGLVASLEKYLAGG